MDRWCREESLLVHIMDICSIVIRNAWRRWAVLLVYQLKKVMASRSSSLTETEEMKKCRISIDGSREKYRQSLRFPSSLNRSPRDSTSDLINVRQFLIWLWFVWLNDYDHPKRFLSHVDQIGNKSAWEKTHWSFHFSFDFFFRFLIYPCFYFSFISWWTLSSLRLLLRRRHRKLWRTVNRCWWQRRGEAWKMKISWSLCYRSFICQRWLRKSNLKNSFVLLAILFELFIVSLDSIGSVRSSRFTRAEECKWLSNNSRRSLVYRCRLGESVVSIEKAILSSLPSTIEITIYQVRSTRRFMNRSKVFCSKRVFPNHWRINSLFSSFEFSSASRTRTEVYVRPLEDAKINLELNRKYLFQSLVTFAWLEWTLLPPAHLGILRGRTVWREWRTAMFTHLRSQDSHAYRKRSSDLVRDLHQVLPTFVIFV